MSQSVYLTVYFKSDKQKQEFKADVEKACLIFKEVWTETGTGFDEKGNIAGLVELYQRWGYDGDADDLEKEAGRLSMLNLSPPEQGENYSFNFHNFGGDLELKDGIDFREIYKTFAKILSSAFGYVVRMSGRLSTEYEEPAYSLLFDEDGRTYQLTQDQSNNRDRFRALLRRAEALKKKEESDRELEAAESALRSAE